MRILVSGGANKFTDRALDRPGDVCGGEAGVEWGVMD